MSIDTQSLISVGLVATAIGMFCVGALWGRRYELKWRIRWIALEWQLARLENRTPRNIDLFDKECDAEDAKRE